MVTVFRELRGGLTEDGRTKLKSPSGTLSTAEAISVVTNGLALAAHFGDGVLRPADVAAGIVGAVVKDPVARQVVWQEYLETVIRERDGWRDFYGACRGLDGERAACSLRLLGIRHHGPGSARAVRRAPWTSYRPDVVLIEGPPEADPLLALAGRRGMRPPVALLGYVARPTAPGARRSGRSPSSPGVAGDPVGAGPRACRCASSTCRSAITLAWTTPDTEAALVGGPRPATRRSTRSACWPRRPATTTPSAGGRTWSSTAADGATRWPVRRDRRGDGRGPRAGPRDPATRIERRREAHMRTGVRGPPTEQYQRVAVVCGAWHVPALTAAAADGRAPTRPSLRGLPKAKVALTWVPWTHGRLASWQRLRRRRRSPGLVPPPVHHPDRTAIARWLVDGGGAAARRGPAGVDRPRHRGGTGSPSAGRPARAGRWPA